MLLRGCIFGAFLAVSSFLGLARPEYFSPSHRVSGIGVGRADMSPELAAARAERMIQSETFAIMRESQAVDGAQRITSPKLRPIFQRAAHETGVPAPLLAAISYLESWGEAGAESPAGPKGIMQFSEATARSAGLQIVYATRYKTTRARQLVKSKRGRTSYKTVARRTSYSVKVRDERLIPERAIFAAAGYLARLRDRFGAQDWAVFAYHCGEGCVTEMQGLARDALGAGANPTVAQMFFAAHPARHRELYEAMERHMQRDYSPTYWFRVKRAEQLLHLYETDPDEFRRLAVYFRNPRNPARRANDRLVVWLKPDDLVYQSGDDLKRAQGKGLVRVFENPDFFGFSTKRLGAAELYIQASPAAAGTLVYIAFETRRLFEALKPHGEKFVPLEIAELVSTLDSPLEAAGRARGGVEFCAHCTGQVFDIDLSTLPHGERECLDFVLDDLGWDGYLGFIQVTGDTLHAGCSPDARAFFAQVFEEAVDASK